MHVIPPPGAISTVVNLPNHITWVVEGASEGYVGRYVGAMVQRYVGHVCRKGLSEGLSGGYVGEWLWVTREPPPRVDIRVTLKGARGHIYVYI